jgi:hypothetical protein
MTQNKTNQGFFGGSGEGWYATEVGFEAKYQIGCGYFTEVVISGLFDKTLGVGGQVVFTSAGPSPGPGDGAAPAAAGPSVADAASALIKALISQGGQNLGGRPHLSQRIGADVAQGDFQAAAGENGTIREKGQTGDAGGAASEGSVAAPRR